MPSNSKIRIIRNCCGAKLWKYERCKCRQIRIIQKNIRIWLKRINSLEPVIYRNTNITYQYINSFVDKNRSKNDFNNKKRENIIGCIINKRIPTKYYKFSRRWYQLKKQIDLFIQNLCESKGITSRNIVCYHTAGRTHHYDFRLVIDNTEIMVEFKFNVSCINDTPQFVSPMKPSQYLDSSYEEYYYDYYFKPLVNKYKLPLPTKEEYLQDIHSPKPKCLREHQEKYYKGCSKSSKYSGEQSDITFYESSKKASHDSISNFISKYGVKKNKLTEYLLETQRNKYYMLFKDNSFNLETVDLEQYMITEMKAEPDKNRYIAKTKTGRNIKILLRWKNGNGIAFPSFQIS